MKRPIPLVYATRRALAEADALLPRGALLEEAVAEQILRGNVSRADDATWYVFEPSTWRARARREPGRLRARPRVWTVLHVQDLTNRRTDATAHIKA